ncbi:Hypothetical protein CAP_6362 [Chondromyces apiculatus DSM 436]|uniref:Uncharacterized protein n=1 Tax=Chondromyces apiculatus DSM 436 TaxID=1192034 RepID=A0A017T112_9BACT|nr:Hypothetical protein CAP_6362 [Chondromyces apiculatus DSM 436]
MWSDADLYAEGLCGDVAAADARDHGLGQEDTENGEVARADSAGSCSMRGTRTSGGGAWPAALAAVTGMLLGRRRPWR